MYMDKAIIGRLVSKHYAKSDSTIKGFQQPSGFVEYRPKKDPGLVFFYDLEDFAAEEIYKVYLVMPEADRWKAIEEIFAEYSRYSVFGLSPQSWHKDDEEWFSKDIDFECNFVKSELQKALDLPESERLKYIEEGREKLIQELSTNPQRPKTRFSWGERLNDSKDVFYFLWLIHTENMDSLTIENLREVSLETYLSNLDRLDIDLVHQALHQAKDIYFHTQKQPQRHAHELDKSYLRKI